MGRTGRFFLGAAAGAAASGLTAFLLRRAARTRDAVGAQMLLVNSTPQGQPVPDAASMMTMDPVFDIGLPALIGGLAAGTAAAIPA